MFIYEPVKNTNAFLAELESVLEMGVEIDKLSIRLACDRGEMGDNAARHAYEDMYSMECILKALRAGIHDDVKNPLREVERINYASKLMPAHASKLLSKAYVDARTGIALDMYNAMVQKDRGVLRNRNLPVKKG